MDANALAEHLSITPLFAALPPHERVALAGRMRPRRFARDEVIFHRDDPAAHLFVIVAGTVKISLPDENGREVVVGIQRGGDIFGDLALFDDAPRSATVTAITETEVLTLGRQDFLAALERYPAAMREMLAHLARTVRRSSGRVEDLVFLDLGGRVAKCLLDISELTGGKQQLDMTQEDLAAFVGATRVSVNRALADLEKRKAIRIGRRHIEILDPAALQKDIRY